jgi:diguanylate cyclase (GGDEF)-like protein
MVATTLAKNCRSFDLVGRWGGEEFLCVLGHISQLHKLEIIGERFRRLIAHSSVPGDDKHLAVTVSLGATLVTTEDSVASSIQRVDRLLYQSKNAGRNCLHLM